MRCVGVEDLPSPKGVKIVVHQRNLVDKDLMFDADHVLASDSANSNVRRMMCIPPERFSFQEFKMTGCDRSALA